MGWLPTRPSRRPATAGVTATGDVGGESAATSGDSTVWRLWRELGELHYSTTFMARQVGRLGWRVALADVDVDPADADAMVAAVTWPDGPAQVTSAMALHMQVAGEYRYRQDADTEQWHVAAASRSRLSDGDWTHDLRTIRRDPADPSRADSPVRAAIPVASELVLLSALARSQARNRTAQRGLLLYPAEQQWADGFDFGEMLERTMTTPLGNEHAAAAVVPPQVPTPSDLIDRWRLLELSTGWDDDLPSRIEAVTRRLALVLDHPPEILLGTGDVNHWSAWQISEDTYRAHVEPLARWPAATLARAIAAVTEVDPSDVTVTPDPSELLRRLPTVADTLTAYTLGLVSDEFTRSVLGATEDDAGDGVDRTTSTVADDVTVADDPGAPDGDDPAAVVAAVDPDLLGDRLARIDADLLEAGRTRGDVAIGRARERIGAKVRTAVRSDPTLTDAIDGVPNGDVVHVLGLAEAARHVNVDVVAAETVVEVLADWWGNTLAAATSRVEAAAEITMPDRPDTRRASVSLLTELVTAQAIDGLESTEARRPAPPTDAVRRAMQVAGGDADPGAPETAAAGVNPPTTLRTSGFATGKDALDAIRTQQGYTAQRWRWRYGDRGDRQQPHPAHVRLDGRLVGNNGRARTVDPTTGDTWQAYPGDHVGCQCDLVPAFTKE